MEGYQVVAFVDFRVLCLANSNMFGYWIFVPACSSVTHLSVKPDCGSLLIGIFVYKLDCMANVWVLV